MKMRFSFLFLLAAAFLAVLTAGLSAAADPVPEPVSPSGAICTTTPLYTWKAVPGAVSYRLKVNDMSGVMMDRSYSPAEAGCAEGADTCSIHPVAIFPEGTGRWMVQAVYRSGSGHWSAPLRFTVALVPPGKAKPVFPSGTIGMKSPTYTWSAVSSATHYLLSVNDSTGNKLLQEYTAAEAGCAKGVGTCSIHPAVSLANGSGSWRIQTSNPSGAGPWSPSLRFSVISGFNQQFNSGNASSWRRDSGAWNVVKKTGSYYTAGVRGKSSVSTFDGVFSDFDYSARVRRLSSGSDKSPSGLLVRAGGSIRSDGMPSNFYMFGYKGEGYFSVWKRTSGKVKTLKRWTKTSAVKQGDKWNELRVVASGLRLSFYINGTLVWSRTDSSLSMGRVGVAMARNRAARSGGFHVDRAVLRIKTADTKCTLPDTAAISAVALSASGTSATITWNTDKVSTSTVEYGSTTAYGGTVFSPKLVTSHSMRLTGLLPKTTYHFRLSSQDASGKTTTTCDDRFKTAQSSSGLHAASVEWLDATHLRATYDWSSKDQLLDWTATNGATLNWAKNTVTISGGSTDVHGMRWVVPIAVSRITARANPVDSLNHINIYTNLSPSWAGTPWSPDPSIGVVHAGWGDPDNHFWSINGETPRFPGVVLTPDTWYDFEFEVGPNLIRTWCSSDSTWYERAGTYTPSTDGIVGLGAYAGENAWGTVVIEGKTNWSPSPPVISSITATADTIATISWETDTPSSSMVEYGLTTAYGSRISSAPLVTSHSIVLSGLTADTTYHFRVTSRNLSGVAVSKDYTLTTQGLHPDEVVFQASGSTFAAILTVSGSPTIQWTFADGTISNSTTPLKDYGSPAPRSNRLRVTPWSALTAVNIGYDGGDGGPDTIEYLDQQNVTAVYGMENMAPYLQTWSSSNNPLTTLDFSNFVSLTDIECYMCQSMTSVNLHNTPMLSRACFEDNNLTELDLSESPSLGDLRAAENAFTSINWGATGAQIRHICTRDNPQITSNFPDMSQFPLLEELFIWNDNQSGTLHPTSTHLTMVLAADNHYTAADFSGTFPVGGDGAINISNNNLASLNISDDPGLMHLDAHNNALSQAAIDGLLETLDSFGTSGGDVDLTGNSAPSAAGLSHAANLMGRSWTVNLDP